MKFGTSTLVLPTRHPMVLAKELATLDFLSQGRLFPAIGLGGEESKDLQAVGIDQERRAGRTDEMIVLMRRLWTEENVTFTGKYFSVEDVTIMPRPWQKKGPPIWIGGRSEAALRRTGRLGDGWLVSSVSAGEVATRDRIDSQVRRRCGPTSRRGSLRRADTFLLRCRERESRRAWRPFHAPAR